MSEDVKKTGHGPLFKRVHLIRLGRLLDMDYTPAELAKELGVHPDTITRSYLIAGMPFTADKKRTGRIWINGSRFRQWALDLYHAKKVKKNPLGPGQAWCLRCNRITQILNSRVNTLNRFRSLVQGECEYCGGKVNRAIATGEDPEWLKNAPTGQKWTDRQSAPGDPISKDLEEQ